MVLDLLQPLEPQVADAIEIVVREVWLDDDLSHHGETNLEKSIERRQADDHRVHAGLDIEIAADARNPVGHVERALPFAAFVEQAGRDRHEAMTIRGIDNGAARHEQHDRDDGN